MRLFLLPISTRRTLIYCQRLNVTTSETTTWLDKGTTRAANLWARWEKKESGWQRKVVDYGNKALKRIPYEEWGLKSIPPLSARREVDEKAGKGIVEVSFPGSILPEENVRELLRKLGTERQGLHRKRMIYSFVGMPISAPFALVPIVPNLPFFYLVFRAWSHWKALSGAKHVEFLLEKNLIKSAPSKILDELYASGKRPFDISSIAGSPTKESIVNEQMILHRDDGKRIAAALDLPELDIELDRAVWQVENAIRAEEQVKEEAVEQEKANERDESKK